MAKGCLQKSYLEFTKSQKFKTKKQTVSSSLFDVAALLFDNNSNEWNNKMCKVIMFAVGHLLLEEEDPFGHLLVMSRLKK